MFVCCVLFVVVVVCCLLAVRRALRVACWLFVVGCMLPGVSGLLCLLLFVVC